MPVWRMQCSFQMDSSFPRDAMIITPHFNDTLPGSDPEGLCEDLAVALGAWAPSGGAITVKAYDAQGTPPVYPAADFTVRPGTAPTSSVNRDVALCLSFYAGQNRPRQRGRLYVPCAIKSISPGSARPSAVQQQQVADLVPIFTGLGGTDVDWVVYSRLDNQPRSVSHWWVDNAWDTQRRRGLQPTSRLEGDVSE